VIPIHAAVRRTVLTPELRFDTHAEPRKTVVLDPLSSRERYRYLKPLGDLPATRNEQRAPMSTWGGPGFKPTEDQRKGSAPRTLSSNRRFMVQHAIAQTTTGELRADSRLFRSGKSLT
jgi:hypothetical protein